MTKSPKLKKEEEESEEKEEQGEEEDEKTEEEKQERHYGRKQPRIQTPVLGHSLVRE